MNAQNTQDMPKIKHESKNKIRVEFDRTPLKDRLKAKLLSGYFLTNVLILIFKYVILLGVSYIVLYPFLTKIAGSVMSITDFTDSTVRLIPKHFSLEIYYYILTELNYFASISNTFFLSTSMALIQTFICAMIGYGLAKFKFKGAKVVFLLVVLTMIIPHGTLQFSMFMQFRFFDVYGLINLLSGIFEWKKGIGGLNLLNTFWPMMILSLTGLGFKNGLYIFMLRQFYRGIPDELEESAYLDGCTTFRTFLTIIIPLSIPMLITVFLFAFSWQWTDTFYTGLFFTSTKTKLLSNFINTPKTLKKLYGDMAGWGMYSVSITNTCGLLIILPLVILYSFLQNFLVEGIERSGITG